MGGQKGKVWLPPALAAAGAALGALLAGLNAGEGLEAMAALGSWLRELSLSGTGGNLLAWAVVAAISLLPALGLLWRERKRADWLLLLAAAELFIGMYYLVNPGLIFPATLAAAGIGQMWGLLVLGCAAGTMAAWALLRLLSSLERAPEHLLPKVLFWAAAGYALLAGIEAGSGLVADIASVAEANTDPGRVTSSGGLLGLVALLDLIPQALGGVVLLWGSDLALALDQAPFAGETVALAEDTARRCALAARLSLALSVAGNALQMACVPGLASVHISIQLPLLTLALCAVLFLLCKYFRRAKEVSDDNASII